MLEMSLEVSKQCNGLICIHFGSLGSFAYKNTKLGCIMEDCPKTLTTGQDCFKFDQNGKFYFFFKELVKSGN